MPIPLSKISIITEFLISIYVFNVQKWIFLFWIRIFDGTLDKKLLK
jgi:hypothetical protein